MDQIALKYWYNSFLRHLRVDRRRFFHEKQILKEGSPDQKSRCRTSAEACHSIDPALGIEPASSRSAVKRSTDWANPAAATN